MTTVHPLQPTLQLQLQLTELQLPQLQLPQPKLGQTLPLQTLVPQQQFC
jgi:hypothetical protein